MPDNSPVEDNQLENVQSGAVWASFCDQLKVCGEQILREEAPADAFTRAEGFRYLTRLTRIALDMYMECNDPEFPVFYRPSHETAKIGADNPDNIYERAQIDGNYDYRIRGDRGSVAYLGFVTLAGGYGEDGQNTPTGTLDSHEGLAVDEQGKVDIIMSAEPQPGNWLPMTKASNTILVRHTFLDRDVEEPASLSIERIDKTARPRPLSAETFASNLSATAAFVEGTARLFADWSASYKASPNTLPPADQALCQAVGGDPNIFYYHSYFELADDEALVIDVARIPDCDNWNLQVNNYWMESLDYRYHKIHVNKHTAHYHDDGSVRLIVSARDPGHPNWLETAGHDRGTLCFRWIGANEVVHPQARVVKLTDLPGGKA